MIHIYDTFTDPDATPLNVHLPEVDRLAGGYNMITGAWTVEGNQAATDSVANARVVIDSGIYDGRAKVDLTIGLATRAAYLIFRSNVLGTNCWIAGLDDTLAGVRLWTAIGAALTLVGEKPFTMDEATPYEIKVILVGDDIGVYVDDVLMISCSNPLYNTQTYVGLYAFTNAGARFDNLLVDDRPTCLYCIPADVKAHFSVQWTEGVAVDALLGDLIERASRLIDEELHWPDCHYAAADLADQTRYFDTVAGSEMAIPRCISITSLMLDTNGDGTLDTTWVQGTDFEVWPYDAGFGLSSFDRILTKEGAGRSFPTGQRRMQIIGKFGGFHTPPAVIKNACIVTVSRNYKRGLQQFQDTGVMPELGELVYTMALDPDVKETLRVVGRRITLG